MTVPEFDDSQTPLEHAAAGAGGSTASAVLQAIEVPTLTKAALADSLAERVGLNDREAHEFVAAFFDSLGSELIKHGEAKLAGFGIFSVRRKAPRPGRNPRTGEAVAIGARHVVAFRPGPTLREAVQRSEADPVAGDSEARTAKA